MGVSQDAAFVVRRGVIAVAHNRFFSSLCRRITLFSPSYGCSTLSHV